MSAVLTWALLTVAAVLIVLRAVRLDLCAARWRELFIGRPRTGRPPPPKMAAHDPRGED